MATNNYQMLQHSTDSSSAPANSFSDTASDRSTSQWAPQGDNIRYIPRKNAGTLDTDTTASVSFGHDAPSQCDNRYAYGYRYHGDNVPRRQNSPDPNRGDPDYPNYSGTEPGLTHSTRSGHNLPDPILKHPDHTHTLQVPPPPGPSQSHSYTHLDTYDDTDSYQSGTARPARVRFEESALLTANLVEQSPRTRRIKFKDVDRHDSLQQKRVLVDPPAPPSDDDQSPVQLRHPRQPRRLKMRTPFAEFRERTSLLIYLSLALLLISNILFFVAFLTNGWGHLDILDPKLHGTFRTTQTEWWQFGLWQCCRNDGLCVGTRWPAFYTAARATAVLSLFGHVLSFAWMLGHTLEKLLDEDTCTMASLSACCFATTVFTLISVCSFGVRWPIDFAAEFNGTDPRVDYSFWLAVTTLPLTFLAGLFAALDIKKSRMKEKKLHEWDDVDYSHRGGGDSGLRAHLERGREPNAGPSDPGLAGNHTEETRT